MISSNLFVLNIFFINKKSPSI